MQSKSCLPESYRTSVLTPTASSPAVRRKRRGINGSGGLFGRQLFEDVPALEQLQRALKLVIIFQGLVSRRLDRFFFLLLLQLLRILQMAGKILLPDCGPLAFLDFSLPRSVFQNDIRHDP